ncbi:universal stress protein [Natrialba swarupiae]|uniref:Universal stress protein n=1 Tax=Natrialba swarupiae TaxID=2448032 RepID=A0A5D5AQH4_9EURY|nr:universal stress protein [Natrialba swarupiae]TYT63253.1 universal stress protein [Natrialba swarupiae]
MEILVPLDDSEPAREALEFAAREHPDATIVAVHIIDPGTMAYGEGSVYAYDALLEAQQEQAAKLFEEAADLASAHDVTLETETTVGRAGREIVAFADERDVDRIVIGSHGRSGASRVLLGSVAEHVARRSPVPVTIVR